MINSQRIQQFISQFPLLLPTVKKLNTAHITWMIAGSGCLFLFGNERKPDDVDMFLKNDEHDQADTLFGIESFFYTSSTEHVRNSNPEGSHAIQLTSQIEFFLDNKKYSFEITDRVIQKRIQFEYEGNNFWVLPPEDVLLIKALLQRGPEVGKKDVEDINNFLKIYPNLDREYLQARITELGAAERVKNIFSL